MANANVKDVMRQAIMQDGYRESPAGSNRTKFGAWFGLNGQPWCAEYVCWCGAHAPGSNPIALSANAAGIQDLTVSQKGGKWIMQKTGSSEAKKKGVSRVAFGDIVSFDFGSGDRIRRHTALALGHAGSNYLCIEGNTSAGESGSQDNGGMVATKTRRYTQICSIARPKYGKTPAYKITKPYTGDVPKLPSRGYFKKGDKGNAIRALQDALNWSCNAEIGIDGIFGNETKFGVIWFQVTYKLVPDGEFGQKCLDKLKALIKKYKKTMKKTTTTKKKEPAKKPVKKETKGEKINKLAIACAYASGTSSSKWRYPTGKPKKKYKETLDKAYPNRSDWEAQKRAGAKCEIYVDAVLKALGIVSLPTGLEDIIKYLEKHDDKLRIVPSKKDKDGHYYTPGMLKGGDVVIQDYKGRGTGAHIFFVVDVDGVKYVSEAQFHGKAYPHISKKLKTMRKSNYDMLRVYRARG